MQRIVVVGTTGSGKTTLAHQIADKLGTTRIELDAIHWLPDWQETPADEFRAKVVDTISANAQWVLDGNYSKVRDLIWAQADTIVWLDYPFVVNLWRLIVRSVRRAITHEELWSGNRESWRKLFSSDSIIVWLFRSYRRRRRNYPVLFAQPEHAHLRIIRHRSPRETQRWLAQLNNDNRSSI